MPHKKMKEERYESFGGLNNKISPYLNGRMEFLELKNLDFQKPGALSKRWGSTIWCGITVSGGATGLSGPIDGLFSYPILTNETIGTYSDYIYAAAGGTLSRVGQLQLEPIFGYNNAGSSYFTAPGSSGSDGWTLKINAFIDSVAALDEVFYANGTNFMKISGVGGNSSFFFGLPRFQAGTNQNMQAAAGGSGFADGFTGWYFYRLAWVNSNGSIGAPTIITRFMYNAPIEAKGATALSVTVLGNSNGFMSLVPPNTDITGVAFFRSPPLGGYSSLLTGEVIENVSGQTTYAFPQLNDLDYTLVGIVGVSRQSTSVSFVDSNIFGGNQLLNDSVLPWNWYPQNYSLNSLFLLAGVGTGITYTPKYLEIFSNRLWMSGFSVGKTEVMYSELGEFELFQADSSFLVDNNVGDPILGMKTYNGGLYIFKKSSFFVITGSTPDSFQITQISNKYGAINNRSIVEYNDLLVFLDTKGVIRYNGANIEILSTKIDPIFLRMNSLATSHASMVYDKSRNQILVSFPVDTSTTANLTAVYDIVQGEWTTYEGYKAKVLIQTSRDSVSGNDEVPQSVIMYGGYSSQIGWFGPNLDIDAPSYGYTCLAKSGFIHDLGNSVTKQFRRLFMDVEPQGASSAIGINLYRDYEASPYVQRTMYQTPFQSRIDFGVPGKALAVEFVMGATFNMVLHGFTIEYRFQRNV